MNYKCEPDLSSIDELTIDRIKLFREFLQSRDAKYARSLLSIEIASLFEKYEIAIICAALRGLYWCELPDHHISEVVAQAQMQLKKAGFEIIQHTDAVHKPANQYDGSGRSEQVHVGRSYSTAWWMSGPLDPKRYTAEVRRREKLEQDELLNNPPVCVTNLSKRNSGDDYRTIWNTVISDKYYVETVYVFRRNYLCIFSVSGDLLHMEVTHDGLVVSRGGSVWQSMAEHIIRSVPFNRSFKCIKS